MFPSFPLAPSIPFPGMLSCVRLFATPWNVAHQAPLSAHGIFQARILEWVAISSSRGSSWSRDQNCVSCVSCIIGRFFTIEPSNYHIHCISYWQPTPVFLPRESCGRRSLGAAVHRVAQSQTWLKRLRIHALHFKKINMIALIVFTLRNRSLILSLIF